MCTPASRITAAASRLLGSSHCIQSSVASVRLVHTGKEDAASAVSPSKRAASFMATAAKPMPVEEELLVTDSERVAQAAPGMFLANTIYTPKDKEQEREFFCDFKYKITRTDLRKVTDARFKDVVDSESKKPLVFVFGWAGANSKNLAKYADVYHAAGCDTFTYYLPTRFIFDQTNDTPYLAVELFRGLEREGLLDRPCFFHMLSDTGIMAHQGMRAVMRSDGVTLNTRGTIMDSCPGPIPEATIPRITILLAVQWICALRDQKGFKGSTKEVMMTTKRHVFPAIANRMKGLPAAINYLDGVWSGHFMRADAFVSPWPELFLYSKKDFYLPHKYMEEVVLPERRTAGKTFYTKCFEKSDHVDHLRRHKSEYYDTVHNFLDQTYYKQLREG